MNSFRRPSKDEIAFIVVWSSLMDHLAKANQICGFAFERVSKLFLKVLSRVGGRQPEEEVSAEQHEKAPRNYNTINGNEADDEEEYNQSEKKGGGDRQMQVRSGAGERREENNGEFRGSIEDDLRNILGTRKRQEKDSETLGTRHESKKDSSGAKQDVDQQTSSAQNADASKIQKENNNEDTGEGWIPEEDIKI
eukprot:TRINITY_DN7499_c0_g4_i1.p2 TRINITY_DN7499_c0_g4~~TRINITY_DN7499_c0_g4_i1.p2  ORF type:complete len:194 (-),score=53.11 TRINITY_DN7499_c0_g4_i1:98-679(-)